MKKYEKLQLVVSIVQTAILFFTLCAAVLVGIRQNAISESLANINVQPMVEVSYANGVATLHNRGSNMITVEGVSLNGHPLGNSKAQVLPDATLDFQGLGLEVFNEGLKTLASTPGFSGMEFDIRLRDVRGKKYLYRSQIGVRIEDLKATEYILTPYGTIPDN